MSATRVWDTSLQQFHGGQDWKFLDNFVEDFSVTTNALGTPQGALIAAREAVDQEPAKSSLAKFLWPVDHQSQVSRLLLGNGASELIDLVVRSAPSGSWKPGPWDAQYKEYQRSAEVNNRILLASNDKQKANLICIVNPCNPTGDYMPLPEIKNWIINNTERGGVVIVDESMQPWLSSSWRDDSLTSQQKFVSELYENSKISLYVIHSWTKLWSCTGLRLGSVVCPTMAHCNRLKKIQVPWSVNTAALAFLDAAVTDTDYMNKTWELTPIWRKEILSRLTAISDEIVKVKGEQARWSFYGREFLSWIWIDVKDADFAEQAVETARNAGVPVRSGKPGYKRPTYVRVAVRELSKVDVLIGAWMSLVKN
ncbi:382_t:CDS:2 [Paraglomus occultum]|uniref:382_t:CDS:1 n=1 Tax=Paraglomus occultum TaxID=144539 RepID=A0A9N9F5P1_9GLOM|nr:382_t:CDS:2 [Paraglomus occultum]